MRSAQHGVKDMTFFKTLWSDQSGASAAEYALILAIVGTGIAVASFTLGKSITNAMGNASNCIQYGVASTTSTTCKTS